MAKRFILSDETQIKLEKITISYPASHGILSFHAEPTSGLYSSKNLEDAKQQAIEDINTAQRTLDIINAVTTNLFMCQKGDMTKFIYERIDASSVIEQQEGRNLLVRIPGLFLHYKAS